VKTDRRNFVQTVLGAAAVLPLCRAAEVQAEALPVPNASVAAAINSNPSASANAMHLAADRQRPQIHLLPSANWMNDPNAPIFWMGKYHMFYQYNPDGAYWGNMHWGHAISSDMVHWQHLPMALAPTIGAADQDGCFSGTAFVHNGRVGIFYTAVDASPAHNSAVKDLPTYRETQYLAWAEDDLLTRWTKEPEAAISAPPAELDTTGFRDPSPWQQNGYWYTVLATGFAGVGGAVLLYRSKDLRDWQFLHVLSGGTTSAVAVTAAVQPYSVWECPEFFALGLWHVLLYSTDGHVYWQTGKLNAETMQFLPEQSGIADLGNFYAAKTQLDAKGNRILWGWIPETRPEAEHKAAGWAGAMALPRVMSCTEQGLLRFHVAQQVDQLRMDSQHLQHGSTQQILTQIDALQMDEPLGEIVCRAKLGKLAFALNLYWAGEQNSTLLCLSFDPARAGKIKLGADTLPLALDAHDELNVRIFIDGSVIEIFANNQLAWTRRFYAKPRQQKIKMQWIGEVAALQDLAVWRLHPISADRLTT